MGLKRLRQRRRGQGFNPVAGQQDHIAGRQWIARGGHIHQGQIAAVNHRPELLRRGMIQSLFPAHLAGLRQLQEQGAHGMIFIQPQEFAIPEQPQRGIADADPIENGAYDQGNHQGRAHVRQPEVRQLSRPDGLVGGPEAGLEPGFHNGVLAASRLRETLLKSPRRRGGGHIAAGVAAHAVGHRQQPAVRLRPVCLRQRRYGVSVFLAGPVALDLPPGNPSLKRVHAQYQGERL